MTNLTEDRLSQSDAMFRQQTTLLNEAALSRWKGSQAMKAAKWSAGTSLLSGAGQVAATSYNSFGAKGTTTTSSQFGNYKTTNGISYRV